MKNLRIYLDTSVIGGCFDPEFKPWSEALVNDFRQRRFVPVLSSVIAAEIQPAPDFVRTLHEELLALPSEVINVSKEALTLMTAYAERGVLGERFGTTCCILRLLRLLRWTSW